MSEELNGIPLTEIADARGAAERDPSTATRGATVVADWTGGYRSRVRLGDITLDVAAPGQLDPMQLVLAALGSCEADTIAARAADMGIRIASLSVEVSGSFDLRAYLGVAGAPGPGYPAIGCRASVVAPGATAEQLEELRRAMAERSPVADTLTRSVRITFDLERR